MQNVCQNVLIKNCHLYFSNVSILNKYYLSLKLCKYIFKCFLIILFILIQLTQLKKITLKIYIFTKKFLNNIIKYSNLNYIPKIKYHFI